MVGQLASTNLGRTDEDALEVAGITPQVVTITITDATQVYSITDANSGETITYDAPAGNTATQTADALVALWEANPILYGSTETITENGSGVITITAKDLGNGVSPYSLSGVANMAFSNTPAAVGSGLAFGVPIYLDANGRATTTRPGSGAFENVCQGISILDYQREIPVGGSSISAEAGRFIRVLRTGSIYVSGGDSAAKGDALYIGVAADSETNQLFNAAGGSRELVPKWFARWAGPNEIEITVGR